MSSQLTCELSGVFTLKALFTNPECAWCLVTKAIDAINVSDMWSADHNLHEPDVNEM